jgi:hypothetical protein
MPYRFDFLRNHFERHHPELLDAFDQGWTNIGEDGRKYWASRSNIYPFWSSNTSDPGRSRYDNFRREPLQFGPYMFTSWTAVLQEMSRDRFSKDPRAHANKTKVAMGDVLEAGLARLNPAIFNVPPMPYSESGMQYRDEIQCFRKSVAEHLAVQIMETEMTKLFQSIQRRSRKTRGFVDILREYAPDLPWLEKESGVETKITDGSGSIEAPP